MKTARFKDVVAKSGRPELHLAWSAPASDRVLQTALKQHRVLTLHQETRGSIKDYGTVGLETAPHVQYLIFPRSLRPFADRKVIGINYELLREGLSSGDKLPPPRPHAPRKAASSNKVVQFAVAERLSRYSEVKKTPSAAPPVHLPEPEKTDPVKREIRKAVDDLKVGHVTKARRRLNKLLNDSPL